VRLGLPIARLLNKPQPLFHNLRANFRSHLGPTISDPGTATSKALELSSGLRQTESEQPPLTYSSLCPSYDLESATARNFGGGFPNDKDVSNNAVHAGDDGLGGGTTARQYPVAEQWASHFPEFAGAWRESIATGPGGERASHRRLPWRQRSELHDYGQSWHQLQAEYSSQRRYVYADAARGRIGTGRR